MSAGTRSVPRWKSVIRDKWVEIIALIVAVVGTVVGIRIACAANRKADEANELARKANELASRQTVASEEPLRPSLEVARTVIDPGEEISVRNLGRPARWHECDAQCRLVLRTTYQAPFGRVRDQLHIIVSGYYEEGEGEGKPDVWARYVVREETSRRTKEQTEQANQYLATGVHRSEQFEVAPEIRLVTFVQVRYETELGEVCTEVAELGAHETVERRWAEHVDYFLAPPAGVFDVAHAQPGALSDCVYEAVRDWSKRQTAVWADMGDPGH